MKRVNTIKSPTMPELPTPASTALVDGDLHAAQRHRASVERFIESGQVENAARDAEPRTPVEEMEIFDAERIGEARSKGEDPEFERTP